MHRIVVLVLVLGWSQTAAAERESLLELPRDKQYLGLYLEPTMLVGSYGIGGRFSAGFAVLTPVWVRVGGALELLDDGAIGPEVEVGHGRFGGRIAFTHRDPGHNFYMVGPRARIKYGVFGIDAILERDDGRTRPGIMVGAGLTGGVGAALGGIVLAGILLYAAGQVGTG